MLTARLARWFSPTLLLSIGLLHLFGCAAAPRKVATGPQTYAFWPPAPDEPRVQFLTSFNSSRDIAPPKKNFEQLVYGSEPEQVVSLAKPYGVRTWNGRIYVCDIRSQGVMVLDLRKQQARLMGASGSGLITKAVDLAISPEGTKYVIDSAEQRIVVFDAEERYIKAFQMRGASPVGIALFADKLYVTDFKAAEVKVLDRTSGQLLSTIGERGGEDGQFIGPLGITVDAQGNVYVSDVVKARVQKFAPDGRLLLAFGETGNRPGNFIRPKHMAVGSDGSLHVVDAAFNNVQVFDQEGRVVGFYGGAGRHPGAMDLPAGLDIDEGNLELFAKYIHPAFEAERIILVANQFGATKIAAYAMGHLKPGKTVDDIEGSRAIFDVGTLPATQPSTQPTTDQAEQRAPQS